MVGKGRKGYLVTLTERKSRFELFTKVESKKAAVVADAIIDLLSSYKERVKTITFDNGKEFAEHHRIAEELQADTYFAHPYSSWERGTNENTNGLLRQYFPKSSDLSDATEEKIVFVHDRLNNRPRKCLDFQSPREVFFQSTNNCANELNPSPNIIYIEGRAWLTGGNGVGLVLAQVFARAGTDVTLLELLHRVAPFEDEEIS